MIQVRCIDQKLFDPRTVWFASVPMASVSMASVSMANVSMVSVTHQMPEWVGLPLKLRGSWYAFGGAR